MMTLKTTARIESIDILRGFIMVIMALDHVRDYFYYGAFFNDPMNLETTTPALFFTRFISHYCAPIFVFLAGVSAYLHGTKIAKSSLSFFLITRGIWLIFLEVVLNNLTWTFNFTYSLVIFQVIWTIGMCMICLSGIIHLPRLGILALGIAFVAGHHVLDGITFQGKDIVSIAWYLLHQSQLVVFSDTLVVIFHYPVLPWIGVMSLGYLLGSWYTQDTDAKDRKKWLLWTGMGSIALFFALRSINLYGDLFPWEWQDTPLKTFYSFFKVTKYPPSLDYLLITLGPGLIFLFAIENIKNKVTDFFLVFGRVPLFYYFLHIILIHALAIFGMVWFGGPWQEMFLTGQGFVNENLKSYGYSLGTTYLIWFGVIGLLFPACQWYNRVKAAHKGAWWISYL